MGAFIYSREEDTPAYGMKNQVEDEEKRRRQEMLMVTQAAIDDENNLKKVGTTVSVLVEGRDPVIKRYFGRTYADSVEIDGMVFFTADKVLNPGDFAYVTVDEAIDMDLMGHLKERE